MEWDWKLGRPYFGIDKKQAKEHRTRRVTISTTQIFRWWQQDSLEMHRIWKGLLVEQHSRESGSEEGSRETGQERSGETCGDLFVMVGLGSPWVEPREL